MNLYRASKICITSANTIDTLDALSAKFNILYLVGNAFTEDEYTELVNAITEKKAKISAKVE